MKRLTLGFLGGAFLLLQATSASAQISCTAPLKPMLDVELLLGRTGSEAKWRRFLANEVTPRFPDGLTAYEATGQWRDPATRKISRERSRVLRIIVPLDPPVQGGQGQPEHARRLAAVPPHLLERGRDQGSLEVRHGLVVGPFLGAGAARHLGR